MLREINGTKRNELITDPTTKIRRVLQELRIKLGKNKRYLYFIEKHLLLDMKLHKITTLGTCGQEMDPRKAIPIVRDIVESVKDAVRFYHSSYHACFENQTPIELNLYCKKIIKMKEAKKLEESIPSIQREIISYLDDIWSERWVLPDLTARIKKLKRYIERNPSAKDAALKVLFSELDQRVSELVKSKSKDCLDDAEKALSNVIKFFKKHLEMQIKIWEKDIDELDSKVCRDYFEGLVDLLYALLNYTPKKIYLV